MAIIVKRNKANKIASGLERGLDNGMRLGMAAREQARREQEDEFRKQQALRHGQRIDAELQREREAREAGAEGIGELGNQYVNDPSRALDTGIRSRNPAIAAAVGTAQQDRRSRVAEIAKRMALAGDRQGAEILIRESRDREVLAQTEQDRKKLVDDIARMTSEGVFRTPADDTGMLTDEEIAEGDAKMEEAVGRINAMAADPNSDPYALRAELGGIRKNAILAKGKAKGRAQTFAQMQEQAATLPGPVAPQQAAEIAKLQEAFRMSPEIYDDPKAMADFQTRYSDALQGYTRIGNERVRIEDEETFRKYAMENAVLKNRLLEAQTATERSQGAYYDAGAQGRLTPKPLTPAQTGEMTAKDRLDAAEKAYQTAQKALENGDEAGAKFHFNRAVMLSRGGAGGGGPAVPDVMQAKTREEAAQIAAQKWEAQKAGGATPAPAAPAAAPPTAPVDAAPAPVESEPSAPEPQRGAVVRPQYDALDVGGDIGSDEWAGKIARKAASSKDSEWKKQALSELRNRDLPVEAKRIAHAALTGDKDWPSMLDTKGKTKDEVLAQLKADAKAVSDLDNAPKLRVPLWKRAGRALEAQPKRSALESLLAAYNRRFDEKLTLKDLGL